MIFLSMDHHFLPGSGYRHSACRKRDTTGDSGVLVRVGVLRVRFCPLQGYIKPNIAAHALTTSHSSVLVPSADPPGFWVFVYRASPLTCLMNGLHERRLGKHRHYMFPERDIGHQFSSGLHRNLQHLFGSYYQVVEAHC